MAAIRVIEESKPFVEIEHSKAFNRERFQQQLKSQNTQGQDASIAIAVYVARQSVRQQQLTP